MDTLPAPFFDVVHVLGWTLLHFLWQGVAIGALYALLRLRTPRGRARYALGMVALVALALCPLLTGWRLMDGVAGSVADADAALLPAVSVAPTAADAALPAWRDLVNASLPWLVALWAVGVLLLTLRAWRHWHQIKRLLREASPLPEWEARLRELSQRLGLRRRVRLLWSQRVATPTLIGWLRPVILLPAAVALGFPVAQVELILAHELGHIRRWDHLANLLQLVLETVLFYHPVVHWISRDVRNEREICCDELVLEVTGGSPRVYVEALADLEDLRDGHHGLALAAGGGELVERVRRIAGLPLSANPVRPQARFVIGLLAAVLAAAIAHQQLARLDAARLASLAATIDRIRTLLAPQIALPPIATGRGVTDVVPSTLTTRIHLTLAPGASGAPIVPPLAAGSQASTVASPVADPAPREAAPSPAAVGEPVEPSPMAAATAPRAGASGVAPPLAPAVLSFKSPVYPVEARRQGIEGKVEFEFAVSDDGRATDVRLVAADPSGAFDKAALRALMGSRFARATPAQPGQRYRETFVFSMHGQGGAPTSSTHRQSDCLVVTGSHICRPLEDIGPLPQLRTTSPAGR